MIATPLDVAAGALGVGLLFAPVKTLCKSAGKALTKVKLRGSLFKFAQGFQRYASKVGWTVYKGLKKIPIVKKSIKKSFAEKIESMIYSFTAKQVVYRFADQLIKNIDIAMSFGGLVSGILDYVYDKSINNIVYKFRFKI